MIEINELWYFLIAIAGIYVVYMLYRILYALYCNYGYFEFIFHEKLNKHAPSKYKLRYNKSGTPISRCRYCNVKIKYVNGTWIEY